MANTFHKDEILRGKTKIERLFKSGSIVYSTPIRLNYLVLKDPSEKTQVMFVVPKKKFKKAKDRNLIKRRMRESYRLRKESFYQTLNESNTILHLAFSYDKPVLHDFKTIDSSVAAILAKCVNKLKSLPEG